MIDEKKLEEVCDRLGEVYRELKELKGEKEDDKPDVMFEDDDGDDEYPSTQQKQSSAL